MHNPEFPLVDSVMNNLSAEAINRLAKKQIQRELNDASRRQRKDENQRELLQRLGCKAQQHMDAGKAQEWAIMLLDKTGIDARECRFTRARRLETLGDFIRWSPDRD